MSWAEFRFYAELNDFLPPRRRQVAFAHPFEGSPAIKDLIESLGVPHTEVDLILVNGEPVSFTHRVRERDRVSIYPMFESLDISPLARLRPRPLRETRFVADSHLGKLARYLRMLGFDTLQRSDFDDAELARISSGEGRILLTKDRALLMRRIITHGYCVRGRKPRQQLEEVLRRFDLTGSMAPFARCMCCNGLLASVPKESVKERLPPRTMEEHDEFLACAACGKVYWQGSHHARMRRFIEHLELRLAAGRSTA